MCEITDLKTQIDAYQELGDRSLIDQIRRHVRESTETADSDPTSFIADKIGKTIEAEVKKIGYEPGELSEFRSAIMSGIGVDILEGEKLGMLRSRASDIFRYLGSDKFDELGAAIRAFRDYLDLERSVINPALEHALSRVDSSQPARRIVTFVGRAFFTEYTRLLLEYNGTKRLGRRDEDGNLYNVYVTPRQPDAWRIVLGRGVDEAEVPDLLGRLTKTQRGYAERAYEIVAEDVESGELDEYKVDETGHYRLKYRYIARRLGVEESNLRKTFAKIHQRVR